MGAITIRTDEIQLDEPVLVEGLPGIGLVGKIATDHLISELDMTYFADIDCEGLPRVAIYRGNEQTIEPPVRLYADEEHDIIALQSDIPVSPSKAPEFADCVTGWLGENDVTPLFLSGLPRQDQPEGVPSLYGVATGAGSELLNDIDVDVPVESGIVSGPTGALLNRTSQAGLDGVGLIVESNPQFPDPEAARVIVEHGIKPITGIDVETNTLVEQAEQIREQREQLANRMQQPDQDESSKAEPLRMYQ